MSELVNDKKVIAEGRKAPLKDVDAPLRDRIVAKLVKTLEDDGLGPKLTGIWQKGNASRTAYLERQQAYLASWDEHLINSTEGPFKGSSNLHIPMPFIVCKTMHARFLAALISADPPFETKARNEASNDRTRTVTDTLRYALRDWSNHRRGVEATLDKWVWDWASVGSATMKWRWDVKYTRFLDVQSVTTLGAPLITTTEDGKEVVLPQPKMVEKEVAVTQKVYEGPVLESINIEDLLIIGGAGDPDLADIVQHRQFLTASELWTLADRKVFDYDAVEKVIEGGQSLSANDQGGALKTQRAMNAGKAGADNEQDLDRYEILESYLQYDVDGSGINAEIIVWSHRRTGSILRATYLNRVTKSKERPFIKADFHLRSDQEYGTGLVELLYPLSKEMDAMHNMRIDWGLISVMPFGFYRATSGIDPETISFQPGSLIPVDNPSQDVFFPNLGNRTVFGMQEEQALQSMVERLTGINDMNLGILAGQGAARTATGARAVMGESNSNLDVHLRRLNRGWKKCLRYLLHMLQQRCPEGLSFRLTGDNGKDYWTQIARASDLEGDFDIEVDPNSTASNPSIQQERAQMIMQTISNPMLMQLGIVDARNMYEAVKGLLRSQGVLDFGRYVNQPDPHFDFTRLTPEEEANRILHGLEVPVLPQMDHQGFLDFFSHIHDTDELAGQFQKEHFLALAKQARLHEQMLAQVKQAQAQSANIQQMRTNAATSQVQAPTGLNPLTAGAAGAGAPAAPGGAPVAS